MTDSTFKDFMSQLVDVETGEIRQIQEVTPETKTSKASDGLKTTYRRVKNDPRKAARFVKQYQLGAHAMVQSQLFNRATRVLMYLQREAVFGGRAYTTVKIIAEEVGTDQANVRKVLKQLEDESFIMQIESSNGTKTILLNPGYFMVGNDEDEEIAKRMWASHLHKKLKPRAAIKRP